MPLASDVDLDKLASDSKGYVGADIESVCREAAMLALRKDMDVKVVCMDNFLDAMKKVVPSVGSDDVKRYEEVHESLSTARAAEIKKESYFG